MACVFVKVNLMVRRASDSKLKGSTLGLGCPTFVQTLLLFTVHTRSEIDSLFIIMMLYKDSY